MPFVLQKLHRPRVQRPRREPRAGKDELRPPERVADRLRHLARAGVVVVEEHHPPHIAARVLRILAGRHVDDLLAHVLRLIRHPLEAPRDRHQRRQRLHRQLARLLWFRTTYC